MGDLTTRTMEDEISYSIFTRRHKFPNQFRLGLNLLLFTNMTRVAPNCRFLAGLPTITLFIHLSRYAYRYKVIWILY